MFAIEQGRREDLIAISGIFLGEIADMILDLIVRMQEEHHMTLVLVTHDMGVARRAHRAIQMKDGHIIADGDPAQLASI